MATNTAGNAGQLYQTRQTHYLAKTVTYSTLGTSNTVTIGILPPKAIVLRGATMVVTGFNDTTGDDLDIGIAGGDDDLFASAVDVNSGSNAITAFDDLAAANWYSTSARTVTCNLTTAATGDGSAGEAIVYLEYIVPDPA
jgi:hypothetical protein